MRPIDKILQEAIMPLFQTAHTYSVNPQPNKNAALWNRKVSKTKRTFLGRREKRLGPDGS